MAKGLGDVVTELMARDVLVLPEGLDRRGMYSGVLSIADVMRLTMSECDAEGGIRPWCEARGIHPSIVDKFVAGQRGPAPQLLKALGLEKTIAYRRLKQGNDTNGLPQD